ncbi:MAG: DUF1684 domain-containing protein [Azonexus sp.]
MDKLSAWQAMRNAELGSEDSWLGMVGLYWLQRGLNRVGSSPDCAVVLPEGPALLGELHWRDDSLLWQAADGQVQTMQTDLRGPPTEIKLGHLSFFVVDRDGQLAARVRDRQWAVKAPFAGLKYFAFAPAWSIVADWQAIEPPLVMEVPNVSGDLKAVSVDHRAIFQVAGKPVSLLPMSVGKEEVFFVFRDRTSGRETYGAGRFLKVPVPRDGKIVLDFNRAYNPPCAFTPFATCPLPPPENWLPFAVVAGEMKPPDGAH